METSGSKNRSSKYKNRPRNTALYQQRLPTYGFSGVPLLKKAILLAIIGIVFTIAGYQLGDETMQVSKRRNRDRKV